EGESVPGGLVGPHQPDRTAVRYDQHTLTVLLGRDALPRSHDARVQLYERLTAWWRMCAGVPPEEAQAFCIRLHDFRRRAPLPLAEAHLAQVCFVAAAHLEFPRQRFGKSCA